jgi:hypothetical protein
VPRLQRSECGVTLLQRRGMLGILGLSLLLGRRQRSLVLVESGLVLVESGLVLVESGLVLLQLLFQRRLLLARALQV